MDYGYAGLRVQAGQGIQGRLFQQLGVQLQGFGVVLLQQEGVGLGLEALAKVV